MDRIYKQKETKSVKARAVGRRGTPEAGDPPPDLYFWFSSQSFWKRGSLRNGSNIGSSRRPAAVNDVAIIAIALSTAFKWHC
jgi:hypothetical protein